MTADALPMVGVVVVNYFGGARTLRCLASLEEVTWPRDRLSVVLVDNGSDRGFHDEVAARFPRVDLLVAPANLGFGGANNLGFDALRHCEYVALLNNDATPDPTWLEPLVDTLAARPDAGAATPKVLLDGRFVELRIRSATVRPGASDPRRLGVQLCGVRVAGRDLSGDVQLAAGFWGWEHDPVSVGGSFAWSDGEGRALVPAVGAGERVEVEVDVAHALAETKVEVEAGGSTRSTVATATPTTVTLPDAATVALVDNAGIVLRPDGSTMDRGYLEPDRGQYDRRCEVFGFSGAAVLLSRRFLDDVGGFDDRFFLYYEDVDLSWRGRARGWTYWCEPASVVRHEHSATVGGRSSLARHLGARNRLLMLTKNAPRELALTAVRETGRDLARAVGRDVVLRLVRRERPVVEHAQALTQVLGGYARTLPHGLRRRRRDRRPARDAEIRSWIGVEAR